MKHLFVAESGNPQAETIVFLHGGGGGAWMWQPQMEQLTEYHCLAPDLPEHGQSAEVKPFTIAGCAAMIAELIRARGLGGRAHLVGLSEGAQVVLALLASAPEVVDRAIVSSALVRPIPGAGLMTAGMVRASARLFIDPFKEVDWWIRVNMKYSAGVPDSYYPQFRETFRSLTADGFTNVMMENQRFRLPAGLEKVQVPTLVVAGKGEYAAMRQSVSDVARALPRGRGFLVAHAQRMSLAEQHNWSMTTPELFTAMVRAWLMDQPLPKALVAV